MARIMESRGSRACQISGPGQAHTRSDPLDAPAFSGLIWSHIQVPHTIHEYMRGGQGGSYRPMESRGRLAGQNTGPGQAHTRSDPLDTPHFSGLIWSHI